MTSRSPHRVALALAIAAALSPAPAGLAPRLQTGEEAERLWLETAHEMTKLSRLLGPPTVEGRLAELDAIPTLEELIATRSVEPWTGAPFERVSSREFFAMSAEGQWGHT